MELYSVINSILYHFPGFVFVVVFFVHGILVFIVRGTVHTNSLGAEEGRDPDIPSLPASAIDHIFFPSFMLFMSFVTVGIATTKIGPSPPPHY